MISRVDTVVRPVREAVVTLPRAAKSAVAFSTDVFGFGLSAVAALWLVYLSPYVVPALLVTGVTACCSIFLAWWQGMYRSVVRYMGLDLFVSGARTAIGSAIVGALLMQYFIFDATPYRWATAYAAFSFIYMCGSRVLARALLVEKRAERHRERVIVYGAGSAGAQLVTSLRGGDEYLPVAIVDDDPALHRNKVRGLEIYPPSDIEALCRRFSVRRILLAVPSAKHSIRRRILENLSAFPVYVQTIPEFGDIVSGRAQVDELRDVEVEDLLGRDPVPPNAELLAANIAGKHVLVTGAGGSIGSELCRQIVRQKPKRLILFEASEPALYSIQRQLQQFSEHNGLEIVALLGSVTNEGRILEAIESFDVETVYHAAAYKHVPLVEQNLFDGIRNNIFGTLNTVRAAVDCRVSSFVLVSTDKAVNPTSIMGATKRFAELILQAEQPESNKTTFSMVRFGNVLESSGSVVPLFREQIRNGGPITVTHPSIIRYFMTIPEAAELVIQAGSMARGGDVFVLDMGDPVRIRDLAYRMVNLMGLTMQDENNPDGDIPIEYIGLRPAEKLYEELLIGSNVTGTEHTRILRADESSVPQATLKQYLVDLEEAMQTKNYVAARDLLAKAVTEYTPSIDVDDPAWLARASGDDSRWDDTIVAFPAKRLHSEDE